MKIKNKKSKKLIILITVSAAIVIALGIYFLLNADRRTLPVTTTQSGEKAISDPDVPGTTNKPTDTSMNGAPSSKDSTGSTPRIASSVSPKQPVGSFVSNHHPNLSGQPAPNIESSVCTTTPGVSCKIQFTNANVVKELPTKISDAQGNVLWEWALQDIGLSEGTWHVSAVAINSTLTSGANDSIDLVIKP